MFKIISINETQFFCNGCGEVFVWEFNTPDKKPPKDWHQRSRLSRSVRTVPLRL